MNKTSFLLFSGNHPAERVQGRQTSGLQADLRHDDQAPGRSAKFRFPGSFLLCDAPWLNKWRPGTSFIWFKRTQLLCAVGSVSIFTFEDLKQKGSDSLQQSSLVAWSVSVFRLHSPNLLIALPGISFLNNSYSLVPYCHSCPAPSPARTSAKMRMDGVFSRLSPSRLSSMFRTGAKRPETGCLITESKRCRQNVPFLCIDVLSRPCVLAWPNK